MKNENRDIKPRIRTGARKASEAGGRVTTCPKCNIQVAKHIGRCPRCNAVIDRAEVRSRSELDGEAIRPEGG
jgi:ssDNA-binding Zn-finger/Zn-ribbon topoisomerase 1